MEVQLSTLSCLLQMPAKCKHTHMHARRVMSLDQSDKILYFRRFIEFESSRTSTPKPFTYTLVNSSEGSGEGISCKTKCTINWSLNYYIIDSSETKILCWKSSNLSFCNGFIHLLPNFFLSVLRWRKKTFTTWSISLAENEQTTLFTVFNYLHFLLSC